VSADPVEDVADALVTLLEAAPSWSTPPSLSFAVVKEAVPEEAIELESIRTLTVLVCPFGESAQKIDRGGKALETYQVYLVIARPMGEEFTRVNLSRFAREVKTGIRQAGKMAGCVWSCDETVKFNPQLYRSNFFLSATRLDYTAIR
jgi:hypothetical protein